MERELAELLCNVDGEGELDEDYSGRGMFEEMTSAVLFDTDHKFKVALIEAAFQMGQEGEDDLLQGMRNLRTDSMGRGIVVY